MLRSSLCPSPLDCGIFEVDFSLTRNSAPRRFYRPATRQNQISKAPASSPDGIARGFRIQRQALEKSKSILTQSAV
jgi:hypothetical protein